MLILRGIFAISTEKLHPTSIGGAAVNIFYNDLELGQIQVDSYRSGKGIFFAFIKASFLSMIHDVS